SILRAGGRLGFSTKSVGDVERHRDGYDVIKPGLRIHSVDLVSDPSSGSFAKIAKSLKESILSESFSPEEKDIALKILAENNAPTLLDRTLALMEARNLGMEKLDKLGHGLSAQQKKMEYDNTGGIFDGHSGMPSTSDDSSHYDRMQELTLKIIANLLGLEDDMESVDSSQSDDTGLNTRHAPGYIKRTLQSKWDRNLEDTIRHMLRQPVNQKKLQRFKAQQDLNWQTLSRIFKNRI